MTGYKEQQTVKSKEAFSHKSLQKRHFYFWFFFYRIRGPFWDIMIMLFTQILRTSQKKLCTIWKWFFSALVFSCFFPTFWGKLVPPIPDLNSEQIKTEEINKMYQFNTFFTDIKLCFYCTSTTNTIISTFCHTVK